MNAEARQPIELLKQGKTNQYWYCDCCGHAVRELSRRGWCVACEHELTVVGKRAREKLNQMLSSSSGTAPTVTDGGSAEAGHLTEQRGASGG